MEASYGKKIVKVTCSTDNCHIAYSYVVPKKQFKRILLHYKDLYPNCTPLQDRTMRSLCLEWASHNLLYNLHIARERVRDVDLNADQSWIVGVGYSIVGTIGWIFID